MKCRLLSLTMLLSSVGTLCTLEASSRVIFFGQVHNDFYYQNRQAQESSESFVMLLPKDKDGKDIKNFGASKPVTELTGTGTNIDQMFTLSIMLTYSFSNWRIGWEYSLTQAYYGTNDAYGKIYHTHAITNHRPYTTIIYNYINSYTI